METTRVKFRRLVLYSATAVSIIYAAYDYLASDAKATGNYSISIILVGWPTIFLIVGAALLLLAIVVSIINPEVAARVALLGTIIALGHFLVVIPLGFCLMSIFIFILPKAIVTVVLPCLLVIATAIDSSRVGRVFLRRVSLPSEQAR